MEPKTADRNAGLGMAVLANVLWGTVFVASNVGLEYANPYLLVFLRFVAGSLGVALFAVLFGWTHEVASELRRKTIWALGTVYAVGFLIQYVGQDMTSAADATLLANLAPALTPVVAYVMVRETLPKLKAMGAVIGFLGLVFIGAPKVQLSSFVGDLLLFCTSLSYAFLIVTLKKLKINSVASSLAIVVTIMVYLLPTALVPGGIGPSTLALPPLAWLAVLYMGIPCGTAAIALYFRGLAILPPTEAATLLLVQLLVGLGLAALLLGESLSSYEVVGAVLILAAVAISSKG
ncbi:MAG TPA: DMT family transporter [Conexivisphaerales archaeon]|nr:DMT family transporter [Conexivisphaerales archaeon]